VSTPSGKILDLARNTLWSNNGGCEMLDAV
jgi:hypothetical protein